MPCWHLVLLSADLAYNGIPALHSNSVGAHCRGTVISHLQIYNDWFFSIPSSRCTRQKCPVPRSDSTPNKGSLRLFLCQTADHHSSSLTRPVAMPRPFTWAAQLLDKGLRCRDTCRQCAFSTYCQQRHFGLRVLICEVGQGGHRPCRAAAGSHGSGWCCPLSVLNAAPDPVSMFCYHPGQKRQSSSS